MQQVVQVVQAEGLEVIVLAGQRHQDKEMMVAQTLIPQEVRVEVEVLVLLVRPQLQVLLVQVAQDQLVA
jgi:hypothetical protein